jgi:hypothetical protein
MLLGYVVFAGAIGDAEKSTMREEVMRNLEKKKASVLSMTMEGQEMIDEVK